MVKYSDGAQWSNLFECLFAEKHARAVANLSVVGFTDRRDLAVSADGWYVFNEVNTLAGNDAVTGTGGTVGINIVNGSSLATGTGNDVVAGTGEVYGILIVEGSALTTSAGNDVVTGTGEAGIVISSFSILDTTEGNDVVTGTGEALGIGIGESTLTTGAGNDVVTGKGDDIGIFIIAASTLTTDAGNDVVAGAGEGYGIFIGNASILTTGAGNDVVNALISGFGGSGTVKLGNGNDDLMGFQKDNNYGRLNVFGGNGRDRILLGEGIYEISGSAITNSSGISMNVWEFERIGGTNGNLLNFGNGTLMVDANGVATFA